MKRLLTASFVVSSLLLLAPSAHAIGGGAGVRGSLVATWGNTTGAPISSWTGRVELTFDPSAAARQSTIDAANDPTIGERTRPLYAPQVQAARATALSSDKVDEATCLTEDFETYNVPWATSVAGISDARIAWEILPPRLDLIARKGTMSLDPYLAPDPNGWYVADRFALPGRFTSAGAHPCPPPATGEPTAGPDPRILALNGQAAVPRVISDWLDDDSRSLHWPVRRTAKGWRIGIAMSGRQTYSDSIYGDQDTQQSDVTISSELYLAGSLAQLKAQCRVPVGQIARARTAAAAVRLARRAGLTTARYAGTKRVASLRRGRYVVTGQIGMGYGACGRLRYKVWHYLPA